MHKCFYSEQIINCFHFFFFTNHIIIIWYKTNIFSSDNLKKNKIKRNMYGCHCIEVSLVIVKRSWKFFDETFKSNWSKNSVFLLWITLWIISVLSVSWYDTLTYFFFKFKKYIQSLHEWMVKNPSHQILQTWSWRKLLYALMARSYSSLQTFVKLIFFLPNHVAIKHFHLYTKGNLLFFCLFIPHFAITFFIFLVM